MTREEAIEILAKYKQESEEDYYVSRAEALDMAIKALEEEPCEDCVSREAAQEAVENIIVKYIPMLIGRFERIPLELAMAIKGLPPVTPKGVTVTDFADRCRDTADLLEEIKDGTNGTLDAVRAEIEQLPIKTRTNWDGCCPDIDYPEIEYVDVTKKKLLDIIDKYATESEE